MNRPASIAAVSPPARPQQASGDAALANPIQIGARAPALHGSTGEASALNFPNPYTYEHVCLDDYVSRACPDCDGVGEVELLALDATRPETVDCDTCDGTGEGAVYCQCGAPVSGGAPDGDNGVCHACEVVFHRDEPDEQLVFVERISPTSIAA